jgi:2-hydroxy-3-oxopropionate reductase
MSKIGFIGLGIMGALMAGHLQAAGHQLFVLGGHKIPDALAKGGAKVCQSGRRSRRTPRSSS